MGNRAHLAMLEKHPHLRKKARGYHADGPPKWLKRIWNHKLRQTVRRLLTSDQDRALYPKRCGNIYDWY